MTARNKKIKKKELLPKNAPPTVVAATAEDPARDILKSFAFLEFILQHCEKSLWTSVCKTFMETDYNLAETCQISNIHLDTVLNSTIGKTTDFVIFSKILNYIPKNERIDYLWIFLDCWNLQIAFDRISTNMVFNGETAPRKNQWPYSLPSEEKHQKFIELLLETDDDPQVYALFRMNNYDIDAVRDILGTPSSSLNNSFYDDATTTTPVDEEFEKLCLTLNPEEREGAIEIYHANGRDIDCTCQFLGIPRRKKGRKNKNAKMTVNRKFTPPKSHLIWPDHDKQEPAEVLLQIEDHPTILDLHYYFRKEATEAVTTFLKLHQREQTSLQLVIITGKGNNSENKAVLKDHVKQLLKNMNIKYTVDPNNTGQILVSIIPQ